MGNRLLNIMSLLEAVLAPNPDVEGGRSDHKKVPRAEGERNGRRQWLMPRNPHRLE